MRNLKRALSLLLSSTMVLGMVVMGGSAVGYQDVDASNDNQEAIEVLQAVGIMSGIDDAGNFDPDGSVTRNQMAVIMAHLLNLDYDYYRGTNTFSDVPEWAAPYVAACVAEGVTAGVGGGLYGGDQKITAAQASLMVMKALGYFQNQEDFGDDWQIATIRQASYINLFDRVNSNADSALTRGQVAQLVLNGLKAKMVDFTGDKGVQIGDVTVGYHAEYTPRANAAAKYNTIDDGTTNINADDQYYVQLGEELYDGDLKLRSGSDDFERPSRVWSYEGQEIGTYAKKELMVGSYTTGVTGKEMYDLLTSTTIKEYDIYSYVDGGKGSVKRTDLARSNQNDLSDTGNGVLTEVYVDNNAKDITFVSVNTWLAQATSDYNASSESATLKIYTSYNGSTMTTNSSTQTVDAEEVPAVADLTKDQFVLVNQSIKDRTKLEVVAISDPQILEDSTVTAFSKNNDDDQSANGAANKGLYESVTTGGTKYDGAVKAYYDASVLNEYDADLLKDNSYNVFLDSYGYIIGLDLFEGTKNYVFITGYNRTENSNISIETSDAAAIFLDGTMKQITVNVQDTNKNIQNVYNNAAYAPYFASTGNQQGDSTWRQGGEPNENKWYTYTVDDNGVYTLKPVERQSATAINDVPDKAVSGGVTTGTIDCSRVYLKDSRRGSGYAYGDDDSVYIVVSQDAVDTTYDKAITEVDGVYTGVQDVKIEIDSSKINSDSVTDLDAGTKTYHVDPVYTVYDSEGYVIGSIVLGEAQGATKNYAYILSGATSEKVENGVTYWSFDAIMGGKKVELTIEDKFGNTVQNLVPYSVQELMFTGDYVTKIENVTDKITCALEEIDVGNDEVYDIVFNDVYDGQGTTNADFASGTNLQSANTGVLGTDNTTIRLQTRTLYTEIMGGASASHPGDKSQTVGLTFVKDAPAFVIQQENGKKVSNEYASVEEALGAMADADTTVNAPGQQFRGRIVAVLNDMGVAEWVVFISSTPVTSGGTATDPTVGGKHVGMYTTVAEVNEYLKSGNVIIDGTWQPTDAATNKTVNLPAKTTLKIDGDFDANGLGGVVINTTSNNANALEVTGKYSAAVGQNFNFALTVGGGMDMRTGMNSRTINVTRDMKITGDLNLYGNGTIEFSNNTASTVSGDVKNADSVAKTMKTTNGATLNVGGNYDANITHNEVSGHSLYVNGTLKGSVNVGNASTTGHAEVAALDSSAKLTVVNGVAKVANASTITASNVEVQAKGELIVSGNLTAIPSTLASGAKITFAQGATVDSSIASKFTNGTATVTNVAGLTFTYDGSSNFVNEEVKVDTLVTTIGFVHDYNSFYANKVPEEWLDYGGKKGAEVWTDPTYAAQLAAHPYIYVTAKLADGITGLEKAEVTVTGVKINGTPVDLSLVEDDQAAISILSSKTATLGFDILTYAGATNISQTGANSISNGDYIEVTFTLVTKASGGQDVTQTYTVGGNYDGPSLSVASTAAP